MKQENIKFDGQNLLCLTILLKDVQCSRYAIEFINVNKILATTEGFIKDNEVYIHKKLKEVKVYLEHEKEDIECIIKYLIDNQIIYFEKEKIHVKKTNYEEWRAPIVFTANKGMDFFKRRIHQKLFSDLCVELKMEEDLIINIQNNDKCLLVCLGIQSNELSANDLTFYINSGETKIVVPSELIFKRFFNKKISLHLLTKPDFRKDVDNLYYKSPISNEIEIKDKDIKIANISEFLTPINTKLDPLEWVIDWETQLPVNMNYLNV